MIENCDEARDTATDEADAAEEEEAAATAAEAEVAAAALATVAAATAGVAAAADGAAKGADADAVTAVVEFYESVNGKAIVLKKDIAGYVANRLQLALFREIFHLVSEDVASVADIDDAIAYGPGLRWAVFGPCQIFGLASQTPAQFGDFIDLLVNEIDSGSVAIKEPTIKPGVKEKLVAGAAQAAGDRDYDSLVAERDQKVIALRKALGV